MSLKVKMRVTLQKEVRLEANRGERSNRNATSLMTSLTKLTLERGTTGKLVAARNRITRIYMASSDALVQGDVTVT